MRGVDCDADAGAFVGGAFDLDVALEAGDALADALKAEMSVEDAGTGVGVESAAVVPDEELEDVVLDAAGDLDLRRVSVADGVRGEFADDSRMLPIF